MKTSNNLILSVIFYFVSLPVLHSQEKSIEFKAKQLIQIKAYDEVFDLLDDAIEENDNKHIYHFLIAKAYYATEEFDDAVDHLELANELKPNDLNYLTSLDQAYLKYADDANIFNQFSLISKMKTCWMNILKLDSTNVEHRERLIRYYLFAPAIIGKDLDKGWKEFRVLKSLNPFSALKLRLDFYIKEEVVDSAKQSFEELHKNYYQKEKMITLYNRYGYFLLENNEKKEALRIFKLNIKRDPMIANSYDSLGDAYLALEDRKNAIESFRKALEIDPEFKHSIEKLDDLLD